MIVRTLALLAVLTQAASAHVQLVTITMSNYAFTPDRIELLADSDYQLHFVNDSSKSHDFSARELFSAGTIAPDDQGKVQNGAVEVEAGATVDVRFTPKKKGSYPVRCTHFLHASFGMTGTATVE
jgi:uncharacterized cupredoxin-like copper-binding protein